MYNQPNYGSANRLSKSPNWFAAVCGLIYVIIYLFLPFYSVFTYPVTGMQLISYNALLVLPVIVGIVMVLGALVMPMAASLAVHGVSFVVTLILMLIGRNVVTSNTLVSGGLSWLSSQMSGIDLTAVIHVSVGYGAIICLALCAVAFILEIIFDSARPVHKQDEGSWAFKNKPNNNNPFGGGGYKPF